jgi:FkbM family methyltransferase
MGRSLKTLIKLMRLLRRARYVRALRHGVAAAIEHQTLLCRTPCATIVDVGANRGQFSLVCRQVQPSCRIIAFEPLATAAAVFKRVFNGDSQTRLVESAIGTEDGKATMHVSNREDSSSLLPIGTGQSEVFPETAESHQLEVVVAPLSKLLSADEIARPAMLKIDVQGFEREVLAGSLPLLRSFDHIYVECSFVELYIGQALITEIVTLLDEQGFSLSGIYNVHSDRDGRAIQADCHFTIR